MSKPSAAAACFCDGFNCSQAVLATWAPRLGLDTETALKIASGFGGGMGRQGHTCGAVTGAYMALGLAGGTDKAAKEATYAKVRELTRRFEEQHGASTCRELLKCDLSDEAGYGRAKEEGLFKTRCPHFVADAAALVEELLP